MTIPKLSKESQDFYKSLNDGNDLTCILMAINYLDQCLSTILQNHFRKGKTSNNILEQGRGALGTFYNRASIAYCLSLISKNTITNLNKFADIRNKFAHQHQMLTFDDPKIAKECDKFKLPKICDNFIPKQTSISNRDKFSIIAAITAQELMMQIVTKPK